MAFTVGERVFYPPHGAALVEDIEVRWVKDEQTTYLVLRTESDLVARVPVPHLARVGVRPLPTLEDRGRVLEVLNAHSGDGSESWAQRCRDNAAKVDSGDLLKMAEVVRDLWRRRHPQPPLSAGERRLLAKARRILVAHLAACERSTLQRAEALLDEALTNPSRPSPVPDNAG